MTPLLPTSTRGIERILLVSLDNIGDTVFASALARPLRDRYPHAHLAVWTKDYAAEIARLIPTVDEVLASDPFWARTPGRRTGRLAPFVRTLRSVRRAGFDLAILASAPWRTAAAVAATGIPIRIGHARRHNERFLTHPVAPAGKTRPVLAELGRLLEPLGLDNHGLRYELDASSLAPRVGRMRALLGESAAALHAFAGSRRRCVSLAEWLTVAQELERRGLAPLWIGSSAELDEVRRHDPAPASRFIDQIGDGSLSDTAAALAAAAVFAGHDSGPLHIAGALGVPVLGVFAPGEPRRTFPQGTGASRMLARPSPADVGAADIIRELEPLLPPELRSVARRA